jgi:hypothetical protein
MRTTDFYHADGRKGGNGLPNSNPRWPKEYDYFESSGGDPNQMLAICNRIKRDNIKIDILVIGSVDDAQNSYLKSCAGASQTYYGLDLASAKNKLDDMLSSYTFGEIRLSE